MSISQITGDELKRYGVTTIPEALRYIPGMIVREKTHGVYDVHIRGFDNVPPNTLLPFLTNTLSLVLIDHRPVYNYFNGGTFWETLPVTIENIDRIEVVLGAASPLYGANAATGIIHIITKSGSEVENKSLAVNADMGSHGLIQVDGTYYGNFDNHTVDFTYQKSERERYDELYYFYPTASYIPNDQIVFRAVSDPVDRLPDPEVAYQNDLARIKHRYSAAEFSIQNTLDWQSSYGQDSYVDSQVSTFLFRESDTQAINSQINYQDLQLNLSHSEGSTITLDVDGFSYDHQLTQATGQYEIKLDQWTVRPELLYSKATYEGSFISGERTIENHALTTRLDYRPSDSLHFIGAYRHDVYPKFEETKDSFQLAISYQASEEDHIRISSATANRAPFMTERFLNFSFTIPANPSSPTPLRFEFLGSEELNLVSIWSSEIGYRKLIGKDKKFNIELFHSVADNYININNATDFVFTDGVLVDQDFYENLDLEATQVGLTADYGQQTDTFGYQFFITVQETNLKDASLDSSDLDITTDKTAHKGTPRWYGGGKLNWIFDNTWSASASLYGFEQHVQDSIYEKRTIDMTMVANVKVDYKINGNLLVYGQVTNIGASGEQFMRNDGIEIQYKADISGRF